MGQSCTGHQGLRAKRRDLRKKKTEVLALGIQGYMAPERRAHQHQKVENQKPNKYTQPQSAVTSRLSSLWPREKACRAQARGGGQRGEGASSRASSK